MGRAQRRREFVRIERPVETKDTGGGKTINWVEFVEIEATFETSRSFRTDMERVNLGGSNSLPVARIEIDATELTEKITPDMRAVDVDSGDVYNISGRQFKKCYKAGNHLGRGSECGSLRSEK